MKKSNKIICLLFSLLFVFSIFPFSVFGSTVNPMLDTYVCDDLRNMGYDLLKYPSDSSADYVTIIDFCEYGYHYAGDQRYYGLWVYLYNPSGKPLQSEGNSIEMSYKDKDNKATSFGKYSLQIKSVSTDDLNKNVFYKLYVTSSPLIVRDIRDDFREYTISSFEAKYSSDVGSKPKSSVVGVTYYYTGFDDGFGPVTGTQSYRTEEITEVIQTKLNAASWFSKTSDLGEDYRYEISSVYFNIPDYFIEKYGNPKDETSGLYSVQGEYYKYVTDGLLVSDESWYNGFSGFVNRHLSDETYYNNGYLNSRVEEDRYGFYDLNSCRTEDGDYYIDYEVSYNIRYGTYSEGLVYYIPISRNINTHICNLVMSDSSDVAYASQASFLESYNKFGRNSYGDTGGLCTKNAGIFSGLGYRSYSISVEDGNLNSSIKSYASTQEGKIGNWLVKLFNKELYADEKGYPDIKPIVEINSSDIKTVVEDNDISISDKLFITTDDVASLRDFYNEYSDENHIYLMRFEVNPYYCPEVVLTQNTSKGALDTDGDGTGYYFEKAVFEDFDVFSFTFKDKNGAFRTVPVSADPIDIVGSVVPGNNTIQPNPNDPTGDQSTGGTLFGIKVSVWLVLFIIAIVILAIWAIWKLFGKFIKSSAEIGSNISERRRKRREFEVENYETIEKMKSDRKEELKKRKQERKQNAEFRKQRAAERKAAKENKSK